jgi:D-cysteine desulfhydrase
MTAKATRRLLQSSSGGVGDARLRELAWVPVADVPTPVERLSRLSRHLGVQVWCKRDDQTGLLYGGNKVRKLEWLLGDAARQRAQAIVTMGARGSHHVLATSIYGTQLGFEVHAVMTPQPSTPHVEENFERVRALGTVVHEASSYRHAPWVLLSSRARLAARGARTYWVPPGGSSPRGALGYVEAGLEIAAQIQAGEMPKPAAIFVTLGSGGTVAGLAVGLALRGLHVPIHAVRVVDAWMSSATRLRWLVYRVVGLLRRHDPSWPAVSYAANQLVQIDGEQLGAGYGVGTRASDRALEVCAREESLLLDTTYTAKTMASLMVHAPQMQNKTVLYWHTLSHPPATVNA